MVLNRSGMMEHKFLHYSCFYRSFIREKQSFSVFKTIISASFTSSRSHRIAFNNVHLYCKMRHLLLPVNRTESAILQQFLECVGFWFFPKREGYSNLILEDPAMYHKPKLVKGKSWRSALSNCSGKDQCHVKKPSLLFPCKHWLQLQASFWMNCLVFGTEGNYPSPTQSTEP